MKVLRNIEVNTTNKNGIQIGDQIIIFLKDLGNHVATAQCVSDEGVLFLFDSCITDRPMFEICRGRYTVHGSFEQTDLFEWLNTKLLNSFPEDLKENIRYVTVPSYGQMFGHDSFHNDQLVRDNDLIFPLMMERKNRIADFENDFRMYWLRNETKETFGSNHFAVVYNRGAAGCGVSSYSLGVRPLFLLGNKTKKVKERVK